MKKYIDESQKGVQDGVVPLNKSTKIEAGVDDNGNLSTTPYTFKETERYEQEEVTADV